MLLMMVTLLSNLVFSVEPPARAAGGRGPELRSRVTQGLDELNRAVEADPRNGQLWWNLGIQAQVAAGGSIVEEQAAVALLERALLLSPQLVASYEHAMAIGDMHRGVRNASRARHFYARASQTNTLSSVQYMYAGLTYELEGKFEMSAKSFVLASRVQVSNAALCSAALFYMQYKRWAENALLVVQNTCNTKHWQKTRCWSFKCILHIFINLHTHIRFYCPGP